MTAENIHSIISQIESYRSDEEFVNEEVLERVPFVFNGDEELFASFRAGVSENLGVDAETVFITGSAATGYSLAPAKFGRRFNRQHSDLDVAVADEELFRELWDALLIRDRTGQPNKGHVRTNVYWGKADAKHFSRSLEPGIKLSQANRRARGAFNDQLACSIRVYRDREQLLGYQVYAIRKALKEMSS